MYSEIYSKFPTCSVLLVCVWTVDPCQRLISTGINLMVSYIFFYLKKWHSFLVHPNLFLRMT